MSHSKSCCTWRCNWLERVGELGFVVWLIYLILIFTRSDMAT